LRVKKRHDRVENLGRQLLKPLSDRCNMVELWRVRLDRAFEQLDRVLADDYRRQAAKPDGRRALAAFNERLRRRYGV
jgi:hypothetical protein